MAKLFQKCRINCGYIVNGSFLIVFNFLQCQLPPTSKYSKKKKKSKKWSSVLSLFLPQWEFHLGDKARIKSYL